MDRQYTPQIQPVRKTETATGPPPLSLSLWSRMYSHDNQPIKHALRKLSKDKCDFRDNIKRNAICFRSLLMIIMYWLKT